MDVNSLRFFKHWAIWWKQNEMNKWRWFGYFSGVQEYDSLVFLFHFLTIKVRFSLFFEQFLYSNWGIHKINFEHSVEVRAVQQPMNSYRMCRYVCQFIDPILFSADLKGIFGLFFKRVAADFYFQPFACSATPFLVVFAWFSMEMCLRIWTSNQHNFERQNSSSWHLYASVIYKRQILFILFIECLEK